MAMHMSSSNQQTLPALDALHISTVLHDAIDQLEVLGKILSATENKDLSDGRQSAVCLPIQSHSDAFFMQGSTSAHQIGLPERRISKIEGDRRFLCNVLNETLAEVNQHQTFKALLSAVAREENKKEELRQIIIKEEECRLAVRNLQRDLIDIKQTKQSEIQKRNELIAHLKDQLQEAKAKTAMECKYIKKDAEVRVSNTQRQCSKAEGSIRDALEEAKQQLDSEVRINAEMESFLRRNHSELEHKVEFWMEKYDKDVETKQAELDALKVRRAQDLSKLQELTQKYNEYEKVVLDDRAEKEKARKRAEREQEELKSCVKLQSWWRGIMVRRQLGAFSKKKKKGKKGKKSGKKGSKKAAKK